MNRIVQADESMLSRRVIIRDPTSTDNLIPNTELILGVLVRMEARIFFVN